MKDSENAFLVRGAEFAAHDMPVLDPCHKVPNRVIPFSEAMRSTDFDQWVCFYEPDALFERVWTNPQRYVQMLQRFRGLIGLDYSMNLGAPEARVEWNCYRNKALDFWFQTLGMNLIPNVRFCDEDSFRYCFEGIPEHSVLAVGTYGAIKDARVKNVIITGLKELIKQKKPSLIVFYGSIPLELEYILKQNDVKYIHFKGRLQEKFASLRRDQHGQRQFF
jgi:hypothetical protein